MIKYSITVSFTLLASAILCLLLPLATLGAPDEKALNYLLYSSSHRRPHNGKIEQLLTNSSHSHASDTVNLQLANSIWEQMRNNAVEFAKHKAQEARPTVNRLLEQANVSLSCKQSLNSALDRLANLDGWALKSKWRLNLR